MCPGSQQSCSNVQIPSPQAQTQKPVGGAVRQRLEKSQTTMRLDEDMAPHTNCRRSIVMTCASWIEM